MKEKDISLQAHERVCEERSKNIQLQFSAVNARLKRLELIIMSTTSAIILLLIGLVIKSM
jgi:hypothetical protein|tara:strand:- start:187 stop:366 length:180 start_codon:yes stop_codon:yes gene_type:complete